VLLAECDRRRTRCADACGACRTGWRERVEADDLYSRKRCDECLIDIDARRRRRDDDELDATARGLSNEATNGPAQRIEGIRRDENDRELRQRVRARLLVGRWRHQMRE
jgi:hypothetical protein